MPEVRRSALVEYSPDQMYQLVADVERYPEFLAWVRRAEVHEQDAVHQRASLELQLAGLRRTITTFNRLEPGRGLDMSLDRGPFREFAGSWRFAPAGNGCRVELNLEFRFDNAVIAVAFNRGFVRVADRMVDDFCRRADELHAPVRA